MPRRAQKAQAEIARHPIAVLLHFVALISVSITFRQLDFLNEVLPFDTRKDYGGRYQYLTVCGLAATWLHSVISLAHDAVPLPVLAMIKTILTIVAAPISALITTLYWGIIFYNPVLLVGNAVDINNQPYRLPLLFDMGMHAFPAIFLWIDFLAFSPPFAKDNRIHPALVSFLSGLGYASFVERCASINGHFPYPFLDEISLPARTGVYASSAVLNFGLYHIMQYAHLLLDRILGRTHYMAKKAL